MLYNLTETNEKGILKIILANIFSMHILVHLNLLYLTDYMHFSQEYFYCTFTIVCCNDKNGDVVH